MERSVREFTLAEIDHMIDYFLNADSEFLEGMGVDPTKLPAADTWRQIVAEDLQRSLSERQFCYLVWELDGRAIGHSNINKIAFGREAFMHLHMWDASLRRAGHGVEFVRMCIGRYFEKFELQRLICEPYAGNLAPHRVLAKIGFDLVKEYETVPGWVNVRQR